ncbi:MAG: hypothetical protein E7666_09635 [Ruminococcaceae bacterium]|nr:hypothetical protein [Oscillospiraceae bacterium]
MKKTVIFAGLLLVLCGLLSGCLSGLMILPDQGSVGNSKTFEKDGITLTLTDKFKEQPSELGFYAYYVADFCGVVVSKEAFSLEAGLAEMSLEQYIKNVIQNNGHKNISPQKKDGLWFYEKTSNGNFVRSYSYKGSDAFYIVQFICRISDSESLGDMFHLWAQAAVIQ